MFRSVLGKKGEKASSLFRFLLFELNRVGLRSSLWWFFFCMLGSKVRHGLGVGSLARDGSPPPSNEQDNPAAPTFERLGVIKRARSALSHGIYDTQHMARRVQHCCSNACSALFHRCPAPSSVIPHSWHTHVTHAVSASPVYVGNASIGVETGLRGLCRHFARRAGRQKAGNYSPVLPSHRRVPQAGECPPFSLAVSLMAIAYSTHFWRTIRNSAFKLGHVVKFVQLSLERRCPVVETSCTGV